MNDFVIADISVHLAASKNRSYRESIILLFQTLACFLQESGLSRGVLLEPGQTPSPSFRIKRSELTDEGFELIKKALHKWVKGVIGGSWPPTDDALLRRELEVLRKSKKE